MSPFNDVSAAAGNGYCRTLVILEGGKDMDVSNKLTLTMPDPVSCPAKLYTVPSGSFHSRPRSISNPRMSVCAAPTNTSALVSLWSPGNQRVIVEVGHSFTTPSIPVNLTLRQPGLKPRVCAVSLVTTDIWAPVSMRKFANTFRGPTGMAIVGSECLSETH